eukprot:CAMPEP_0198202910 /NCGR_PEP_ID=MMETSP1445-20131203/6138_1 /TAXON_ID=36898 /ORGANISM="Pyramimonas sp., Strain CCMP2087" /LENGTH=206 /DNA_ID=CAMNT_0043874055 /DNA_START=244 /DNA_END=861 /DNA_ORIENTATION=-
MFAANTAGIYCVKTRNCPSASITSRHRKSASSASADDSVWYFGYGANMDPSVLRKRNITPLEIANARAPRLRLCFNHRGAYGNVIPSNGIIRKEEESEPSCAHGVLLRLSNADMKRMGTFEGGYDIKQEEVITYGGKTVRAAVFVTKPSLKLQQSLPPMSQYLRKLQSGARFLELDQEYVAWLEAHPSIDADIRGKEYYDTPLQRW